MGFLWCKLGRPGTWETSEDDEDEDDDGMGRAEAQSGTESLRGWKRASKRGLMISLTGYVQSPSDVVALKGGMVGDVWGKRSSDVCEHRRIWWCVGRRPRREAVWVAGR